MPRDPKRQARAGQGRRLVAVLAAAGVACCCHSIRCWTSGPLSGRRALMAGLVAGPLVASTEAMAFQNAVYQYERSINDAKKPGPQPTDLGLLERDYLDSYSNTLDTSRGQNKVEGSGILKECVGSPANCLSTTYTQYVDDGLHDLRPWRFKGKTPDQAMQEVADVVAAYPPGQQGIDGGGFAVKGTGEEYLYVQYESLKRGHRDDVEFAVIPGTPKDAKEGSLYVRSSSRQGGFDYGVNACRLNRLAEDLMKKGGWQIEMVDAKNHERYWSQNCQAGDRRKAPFVVRKKFPEFCKNVPESP